VASEIEEGSSIDEIRQWIKHPVTRRFMEEVKAMREEEDMKCHESLAKNQLQEAAYSNAYCVSMYEVLSLPEVMMEEQRKEKADRA
jgi:hypothetical protein